MILTLLLALGPLVGIALVLNSPEEVIPGKPYLIHAARICFFLGESIFLFIILLPQTFLAKGMIVALPVVVGFVLAQYKRHLLVHTLLLFAMVSYIGSLSLTLATCAILGSAFTFVSLCDELITEDQVRDVKEVGRVWKYFALPLGVSLIILLLPWF